jgi:hypothetical protein
MLARNTKIRVQLLLAETGGGCAAHNKRRKIRFSPPKRRKRIQS